MTGLPKAQLYLDVCVCVCLCVCVYECVRSSGLNMNHINSVKIGGISWAAAPPP